MRQLSAQSTLSGIGTSDASDEWKRPERACAAIFVAQILARGRTFAEQQSVAIEFYQIEFLPARGDRNDP